MDGLSKHLIVSIGKDWSTIELLAKKKAAAVAAIINCLFRFRFTVEKDPTA